MKRSLFTICLASLTLGTFNAGAQDPGVVALLKQAVQEQGGERLLRSIDSVQWTAVGYRNELEESERPEGPYVTDFFTLQEADDYAGNRSLQKMETAVYPLYKASSTTIVNGGFAMQSNGGANTPGTPQMVQMARERRALSPERLLLTALDAKDVQREPDTALQGLPHNVVMFHLDGAPVRIFLNSYTHLPTAMDYSGPLAHASYYAFLGDVTLRTYYSLWWLGKGGVHLPMQRTVEGNGLPDQTLVIRKLEINAPLPEADLTIPDAMKAKFNPEAKPRDLDKVPLGLPTQPSSELAPGIVLIPGPWNVTLVRQKDGIIVLEAPLSSGYSAQVIAEARRRFPGLLIKAVISTSDSWPHIAGIREYVAEGIPLYALNLNQPILERLIQAPRTSKPDLLARSPKKANFQLVADRMVLGIADSNRIEIIPIRGETSERQMMVYFPKQHLLYGSDPFQQRSDGSYFYPQTVDELVQAVGREQLQPERFFMMHIGPAPWAELQKAITAAETKNTPDGNS